MKGNKLLYQRLFQKKINTAYVNKKGKSFSIEGKLKLEQELEGTIRYTSLFGEIMTNYSESREDWAPTIPDLEFKTVSVKKINRS